MNTTTSGVTTKNLSGKEISKRLKIGGTKPISFIERDKMAFMTPKRFDADEEEKKDTEVKDVKDILKKIKSKYKRT